MASTSVAAPFSRRKLAELGLDDATTDALLEIQHEVGEKYREDYVELRNIVRLQASALDRIQNTLAILVRELVPQMAHALPPAMRIAGSHEEADIASIVVDPIGAGYTLSQADMARMLSITAGDVSHLVRIFGLKKDLNYAVVVRADRELANFHPRAVDRLRKILRDPQKGLKPEQARVLRNIRARLKKSVG